MINFAPPGQYIKLPNNSPYFQNVSMAFTSLWAVHSVLPVTPNRHTYNDISIGTAIALSRQECGLLDDAGQKWRLTARASDAGAARFCVTLNPPAANTLYAVVMGSNYAANTMEIYINSVLQGTAVPAPPFANPSSNTAAMESFIGIDLNDPVNTSNFAGVMEDMRFYTRMLSQAEVETIQTCRGTDGMVFGLIARYLMQEGAAGVAVGASQVKDRGPSGLHGSGNGGLTWAGDSRLKWRRRVL